MQLPNSGLVVGGKYRILRPLGEGGMGTVFEVENTSMGKRMAIKWLRPHLLSGNYAHRRLLDEARATASIRHRNVVDVFDVVVENDVVFLVMELLEGELLSAYFARSALMLHEAFALLIEAMHGLSAAHAAGVVHRDVKPGNIFLEQSDTGEQVPKIIDFGISRIPNGDEGRITHSGIAMGTPRYVSFEQLRNARDVDVRTDVYAFGVILYETIVGQSPYDAASLGEQAIRFVTTVPVSPKTVRPEIPDTLNALVMSAIARDREDRIPSIEQLARELAPFARAEGYLAGPLAARAVHRSEHGAPLTPDGRATLHDLVTASHVSAIARPAAHSGSESGALHAAALQFRSGPARAAPHLLRPSPSSVVLGALALKGVLLGLLFTHAQPADAIDERFQPRAPAAQQTAPRPAPRETATTTAVRVPADTTDAALRPTRPKRAASRGAAALVSTAPAALSPAPMAAVKAPTSPPAPAPGEAKHRAGSMHRSEF